MALQTWTSGLLVLAAAAFPPAAVTREQSGGGVLAGVLAGVPVSSSEATTLYDPQLCYILDGFLCMYGLIITGMFVKEKFFRPKAKENIYSDLRGQDTEGYAPLRRDAEGGRNRRGTTDDDTYTDLTKRTDGEYKELPMKRGERHRKNEQVYQGLSAASRDTYDALQMQPLPPPR